MSKSRFFCFGKNDFCADHKIPGACLDCGYMNGKGGEIRPVPEPTRLDRSAWEPCEVCEELKDPCLEDGCFKKMETGKVCGYNCTRFVKYQKNIKRLHEAKFCPECGRPLTDAAWKMLERRLAGREHQ